MTNKNSQYLHFLMVPNDSVKANDLAFSEMKVILLKEVIDAIVLFSEFNFPSLRKYALIRSPPIQVIQELSAEGFRENLLDGPYARYTNLVCVTEKPESNIRNITLGLDRYNFLTSTTDLRQI
jgi:hypothetical protein